MIQMTCPFCKKEFPYDNGRMDKEIAENSKRIAEINMQLAAYKSVYKTPKVKEDRQRLIMELTQLHKKQSDLKATRKALDQQVKQAEFQIFKDFVRERYGENEYHYLLEKVAEDLQAYKLSHMMWHEYTRSGHKSAVTSIGKL